MAKLSLEPAEHTNRLAWRPPFLRFLPRFRAFLFARIKCAEHYWGQPRIPHSTFRI